MAVGQAKQADDVVTGDAGPVWDDDDEESAELTSEDCITEILGVTMELVFGIMPFGEGMFIFVPINEIFSAAAEVFVDEVLSCWSRRERRYR